MWINYSELLFALNTAALTCTVPMKLFWKMLGKSIYAKIRNLRACIKVPWRKLL